MSLLTSVFSIPTLSVLEALEGPANLKICDPYGYIQDPPLCNRIRSIETANGKLLDHKSECQLNGKLSVVLTSGEELTGRNLIMIILLSMGSS